MIPVYSFPVCDVSEQMTPTKHSKHINLIGPQYFA